MKLRVCICLFSLCALMTVLSYVGYQAGGLAETEEETPEPWEVQGEPEVVLIAGARYHTDFFDRDTGKTQRITAKLPQALEGKTEAQVIDYLRDQEKLLRDQEKGFYSLELLDFSEEAVVVRKLYSSMEEEYDFYLRVQEGMVVIYRSDRETFYRYTNMKLTEFSPELQIELRRGLYVKDLEELYDLLENAGS